MANPTLGTATLRTRLDPSGLRTGLAGAKRDTQRFTTESSTAIRGIGTAFGAVVASQGVRSYLNFMRTSATLAHQATTATALYEKALRRNNESLEEGRRLVERLADQFGLTNDVVEESATFLLRQGASLETVERALVTAGASGAAAGFDLASAFNNVSVAVATGNSALLKTSGIVSTLGAAELEYARSVGKTVDQLTQQERIQARVNAIYEETKSEIEDVDILLQGLPKSQAEVTTEVRRFRQTAGDLALKVIVPLNQAVSGTLRIVNSLPTPVKNAGIAMAGAATGATALATGIIAIRGALRGLSGLGVLSFGPAGWVVLGVTAVAGLAAALSGQPSSLDRAVKNASEALAGGDADTLSGALDEVMEQVDGPVRTVFKSLQDELRETGKVGVEQAQVIANAFANLPELLAAQERVLRAQAAVTAQQPDFMPGFGGTDPANVEEFLRDQLAKLGRADVLEFLRYDAENNRLRFDPLPGGGHVTLSGAETQIVATANQMLAEAGQNLSGAERELAEANKNLEAVLAKINAPVTSPGGGGAGDTPPPGTGRPDEVQQRVQALRDELVALQREVDHGLADAATLAERQAATVDSAIRDLIRMGAGDNLINTLLGELGEFEGAVRERAKRLAPIIRAELMDERLRAERDEIDRLSAEARSDSELAARRRLGPVATEWADYLGQELDRELHRFRSGLPSTLGRRRFLSVDPSASVGEVRALRAPGVSASILPAHAGPGSVFTQFSEYLDRETQRQLERMQSLDITTTNTDRAIRAERELAMQRQRAQEQARPQANQTLADFRQGEADRIAALRYGGENARTYTQQVQLQAQAMTLAAREGITLTEALKRITETGRSVADVQADLAAAEERWRTAGDDAGRAAALALIASLERELANMQWRPTLQTIFGDPTPDYEGRTEAQLQAAADRFSNTVISAGFAFGDAAIRAFQDGDIIGVIRSGLSGAGSILGGADLGSVGFLGGSIGIGALIAGGLGLLGGLIGLLAGGGSRDADLRRQREAATARSVPAIQIRFEVTQHNQYNGAPSDPRNEQAFARQADALFEGIYKRHLGPRLESIERRLGMTGAGA